MTGLDPALQAADLVAIFQRFGEIKSAKVSQAEDGSSKGYGFVWFATEKACSLALKHKELPYPVKLYQPRCFRDLESNQQAQNVMIISNFPDRFTES